MNHAAAMRIETSNDNRNKRSPFSNRYDARESQSRRGLAISRHPELLASADLRSCYITHIAATRRIPYRNNITVISLIIRPDRRHFRSMQRMTFIKRKIAQRSEFFLYAFHSYHFTSCHMWQNKGKKFTSLRICDVFITNTVYFCIVIHKSWKICFYPEVLPNGYKACQNYRCSSLN